MEGEAKLGLSWNQAFVPLKIKKKNQGRRRELNYNYTFFYFIFNMCGQTQKDENVPTVLDKCVTNYVPLIA